ncbi:MAG: DedA family protein [Gammaproteobacteria bacterium]|nr:DedA family protein [Gammaproteobacteria bacterium]
MDILHTAFNFLLHLDTHLFSFVSQYGSWTYALLFLIIFCETGLVVVPFLPGDSLLFASGAIAANPSNSLDINLLFILLVIASIAGNTLNYVIGRIVGPKVFYSESSPFLNKQHLVRAHHFYEKFGGKALVLARFMPIIRSFAPFVAGIARMNYKRFTFYNIAGGLLWIGGLLYISYLFSNLPMVKEHFSTVILAIIVISLLPPAIEFARHLCLKKTCH